MRWHSFSYRFGPMALLAACLMAMAAPARASEAFSPERAGGRSGIGVSMGGVNGVSLKLWANESSAFQFRLGSLSTLNSAALVMTYAHHFRPIDVPDKTFSLPLYLGLGVRYAVSSNAVIGSTSTYMDGGIATLLGLTVLVPDLPVDLYFELRPTFVLYDPAVGTNTPGLQAGFLIDAGLGAHFYY